MRRLLLAGVLLSLGLGAAIGLPGAAPTWALMTPEPWDALGAPAAPAALLARDVGRLGAPLAAAMPTPTASWAAGICTAKAGFCDAALDVGSGYVVYLGGGGPLQVFNTSGTELVRINGLTRPGRTCHNLNFTDDQTIAYDRQAQRWVMHWLSSESCVAISQTSDPRGAWWLYQAPTLPALSSPNLLDYPVLSVWNDAYYQTWTTTTGGGAGRLAAWERAPMLLGQAAHVLWKAADAAVTYSGMQFASAQGPTASTGPGVLLTAPGTSPASLLKLYTWTINWTTGSSTLSSATDLTVTTYTPTNESHNPINGMMSGRVAYWNRGSYQQLVAAQPITVSSHREVAWYELRNTGSGWAVQQQQQFAPDTAERDYPAINVDSAGNMALAFYHSTNGLSYVGRLVGDTASTMPQTVIAVATSADVPDRATLALQDDDCTFWAGYGHRVASFKFATC